MENKEFEWKMPFKTLKIKIVGVIKDKVYMVEDKNCFFKNDILTTHSNHNKEVELKDIYFVNEVFPDGYTYELSGVIPDAMNQKLWRLGSCGKYEITQENVKENSSE